VLVPDLFSERVHATTHGAHGGRRHAQERRADFARRYGGRVAGLRVYTPTWSNVVHSTRCLAAVGRAHDSAVAGVAHRGTGLVWPCVRGAQAPLAMLTRWRRGAMRRLA
jgi:hypothetical protein